MPNPQQNNSKETKTPRLTHFLHGGSPSLVLQVVQPFFKYRHFEHPNITFFFPETAAGFFSGALALGTFTAGFAGFAGTACFAALDSLAFTAGFAAFF